jgi:hypothetical protein
VLLSIAGAAILMGTITTEALYPAPYNTATNTISNLGGTTRCAGMHLHLELAEGTVDPSAGIAASAPEGARATVAWVRRVPTPTRAEELIRAHGVLWEAELLAHSLSPVPEEEKDRR